MTHEEIEQLLAAITLRQEAVVAAIDDLNTAVANLQAQATATNNYIATIPAQVSAAVVSAESALNTSVEAATTAINAVVEAQKSAVAAAPQAADPAPATPAPVAPVTTDS